MRPVSAIRTRKHGLPYKSTYTCMRRTTSDGRFAIANFVSTFPIFCRHSSKFTRHPIFFGQRSNKNRCRTSDVGCRKSELDTCKQPNINVDEGKIRYRKSAVGCHTCVHTLRLFLDRCDNAILDLVGAWCVNKRQSL